MFWHETGRYVSDKQCFAYNGNLLKGLLTSKNYFRKRFTYCNTWHVNISW
jgi:hypothetical protein